MGYPHTQRKKMPISRAGVGALASPPSPVCEVLSASFVEVAVEVEVTSLLKLLMLLLTMLRMTVAEIDAAGGGEAAA
jgi:hypothetical protein